MASGDEDQPPAKRQRLGEGDESKIDSIKTPLEIEETSDDEEKSSTEPSSAAEQQANELSSTEHRICWPWTALKDAETGRNYYFNALTNSTCWEIPKDDIFINQEKISDIAAPKEPSTEQPLTLTSEAAQKAWEEYWIQWKTLQGNARNLPQQGSSTFDNDSQRGPALGISEGANVMPNMSIYVEHKKSPNARQLGRPARQQVRPPQVNAAYTQGSEEYNIWYGKYLSDRWENGRREDREKATTRCNPFSDSGFTKADFEPEFDRPIICLYFAKGCCYMGGNCRYYHRVPTEEDNDRLDDLHDIFGRERHAHHRDDMSGVGSFTEDCRTLYVGDLKVHRVYPNAEEKTEELIRQQFGTWGPINEIKVIRNRNIAFVTFRFRASAEFAKVAMAEQRLLLDRDDDQICVRWAYPGKNIGGKSKQEEEKEWETANKAMMNRLNQLGYTQDDLECYVRWEIQESERNGSGIRAPIVNDKPQPSVISQYPNTDDRVMIAIAGSAEMADMYPEVKKIIEMTKSGGSTKDGVPIPLSQQQVFDEEQVDTMNTETGKDHVKNEASNKLKLIIDEAREKVAFEDGQKMDKILSRMNKARPPDAFDIDV